MIDGRSETTVVSGDDGGFHIEELSKNYVIEFIDPGGVMGYCPPLGDILFRLEVAHPDYRDLHLWMREHLSEAPPNHDGPFVLRDVQLIPRDK